MSYATALPKTVVATVNTQRAQPRTATAQPACFIRRPKFGASLTGLSTAKSAVGSSRVRLSLSATATSSNGAEPTASPPQPTVLIDNFSDPFATIVKVEFGDYLGELVDTMNALRALDLNITKAKLSDATAKTNRFYVTDRQTSEKITASSRIEEIRSTIFGVMMEFHPEATQFLAMGKAQKPAKVSRSGPLGPRDDPPIPTSVKIFADETGGRSRLDVVTTDRPGLLVDIVSVLKDISVNVISAEIDTIGIMAHDILFLTYKGSCLNPSMELLVVNALQYELSLAEISLEHSY
uniref:ACT domain-containing protein n=1 Tax=Pyramimonas obovata TaxID=1411642 RepID=A0A7S0NB33_9CHLO|eukprot:CAMPEP_0118934766 /NCGR_PEP_ID=MMETSP1169-20130426/14092_1 /TAXON_ID=36882 /ORGANISM="Pyramimonas obovata, Strain CCMP722" /LENGTH=293 /DNA_ID=CAMNT_0006877703 /DNA_START=74 /DNA_END=955 /DNA_ORIENTATION=+